MKASRVERREAGSGIQDEVASGVCRVDHLGPAVLALGKKPLTHIKNAHVALGHTHASTLRATTKIFGIKVVVELAPCNGCQGKISEGIFHGLLGERPAARLKACSLTSHDLARGLRAATTTSC